MLNTFAMSVIKFLR